MLMDGIPMPDARTDTGRIPGIHYSHAAAFALTAAAAQAAGVGPGRSAPAAAKADDGGTGRRRRRKNGHVYVGAVLSSDIFYADRPATMAALVKHGTLAVEMEAAGLYAVADVEGKQALAICTISDLLFRDASLPAAERELLFDRSVALGLAAFATA